MTATTRPTTDTTAAGLRSTRPSPMPLAEVGSPPTDSRFAALKMAYEAGAGLMGGDDLARLLAERQNGDFVSLARLIASGEIFGFHWQGDFWVPLFQLDPSDFTVRQAPQAIASDLAQVFDGWSIALWFVRPNSWLHGQRPIDVLDSRPTAVLEAARGDHFIAGG